MNMKEIEALVTVSKSRSFYEAADALNYTPSVISKYVLRVEKELGVVLFARGSRASSVALTTEGEALMPHFVRMLESFRALHSDAAGLLGARDGLLRIGTGVQTYSPGMDEIMADFILAHPEVRIEQTKLDFESQLHALYSGGQDGIFTLVQHGSHNAETLSSVVEDARVDAFPLVRVDVMYLGISENDPLAALDDAPLPAFRDFAFAFHSDKDILVKAGTMAPFAALSEKAGFPLKSIYLDPRDTSAYYLATQMKIAIPSLRCSVSYPGVKFVRLSDWDACSTSYFLSLKSGRSPALAQFKKSVQAFLAKSRGG
ncbi:regulatory helix-turn-helix protein, lysR family [Sporobacter termitidis DSM 10068]|uniref:Regulatory helix-turn-helix protein, lysR family n=1 Tax=Sporobacter termitidis DSM 10068 TaxID=1123282 RepID=A0A1M5WGV4_9FIRM|nr:LysR family transcriptional regulator [Sporobacter termitidis]SHH86761.1 regulatory helix-turn-helix protein, lysR family [Sporobacter termitidis DSM 10068]